MYALEENSESNDAKSHGATMQKNEVARVCKSRRCSWPKKYVLYIQFGRLTGKK